MTKKLYIVSRVNFDAIMHLDLPIVAILPPININISPTNRALQVRFQLQVSLRLFHSSCLALVAVRSSELDFIDLLEDFRLELSFILKSLK